MTYSTNQTRKFLSVKVSIINKQNTFKTTVLIFNVLGLTSKSLYDNTNEGVFTIAANDNKVDKKTFIDMTNFTAIP